MRRLTAVLLWSVIAAAFIGPGTVTTAASAGASHGFALLWALLFSTVACLVLQEASGRLTIVTGESLARFLRTRYSTGLRGGLVVLLVSGAILVGCAAYQAGNILGGVAGAALATELPEWLLTLSIGSIVWILLWFQAPGAVARSLSVIVAIMGVAFLWTAWRLAPPVGDLVPGILLPSLPAGSGVLVLGLIGTTVVPYNIFLGSGLAKGERLGDLRLGLAVAVGLGGLISMGVLVVGTAVTGPFDFAGLRDVLTSQLGRWAGGLFAVGLLGAGLSSAITAPLAAAVTARDLFGDGVDDVRWGRRSRRYRAIWLAVLATGVGFGLSGARPIPVIILAQALNGVLLPWIACFLFVAINNREELGDQANGWLANILMAGVVLLSLLLGVAAVARAGARSVGAAAPPPTLILAATAAIGALVALLLWRAMRRRTD